MKLTYRNNEPDWPIVILVVIGLFLLISGFYALGAALFTWAWNTLLPTVWASAPKLTFWHGLAAVVLIGTVRSLLTITTKKE